MLTREQLDHIEDTITGADGSTDIEARLTLKSAAPDLLAMAREALEAREVMAWARRLEIEWDFGVFRVATMVGGKSRLLYLLEHNDTDQYLAPEGVFVDYCTHFQTIIDAARAVVAYERKQKEVAS